MEKLYCRLYGYEAGEDAFEKCKQDWEYPENVGSPPKLGRPKTFIRKPLCGTGGLKDALTSAGTFKDQKVFPDINFWILK